MDIKHIEDSFILYKKENGLSEKSVIVYQGILKVFREFLDKENGLNEPFLRGFTVNEMECAINYYKDTRKIKYKTSMRKYKSVINEFFDYLLKQHKIQNIIFKDNVELSKFNNRINDLIENKLKLKDGDGKEPISEEDADKIRNKCDELMDNLSIESIKKTSSSRDGIYDDYISAMALKLMLLTGLKPGNLIEITNGDIDLVYNTITVNGYELNLPKKLYAQIKQYNEIKKRKFDENLNEVFDKNTKFFVKKEGQVLLSTDYNVLSRVSKQITGNTQLEPIGMYGLQQMIMQGINAKILKDLTGFSYDVYEMCHELAYNGSDVVQASRYISAKIRGMELFDSL